MCKVRLVAATVLLVVVSALPAAADTAVLRTTAKTAQTWDVPALRSVISRVSREHGIDPKLIDAVVRVESSYKVRAVSRKGAMGLMQLMPATARRLSVRDPFDPEQNIKGGVREVARLIDRYSGNLSLALAAYNAGEGAVQRYRGVPPYSETRNYVRRVMTIYTGRPYSLGKTYIRKRARVRLAKDPATGRTVITNQTGAKSRTTTRRSGSPLAGGFGK